MRYLGGNSNNLAFVRGLWGQHGALRNIYSQSAVSNKSGYPSGYLHPKSWCMPPKAGGLSSSNEAELSFDQTGLAVGGKNAEGTSAVTFTLNGTGGLVVSGIGTATVTFDVSGDLIAVASSTGTATLTFSEAAAISAQAGIFGTANVTIIPSGQSYAVGYMEGLSTNETEFSASNLASAVWNALAASYNSSGTMGEKVNAAGTAGNPWTEVIEGTYTAEQILRVIAAALAGKVSGAGTGTEVFKGLDGTTDRIVSTVDDNGNRTEVVVDGD